MGEPSPAPRKRGRPRKDKSREDREREETPTEKMRDRVDKKPQQAPVDEKFNQWKTLVPLLYDWLASHSLLWPSLSCRWGPQYEQGNLTNRQRLYLSEQTDGTAPNTLVIANCEVVKARVAATEHIAQFNEAARSTFVKKYKTILHPGEQVYFVACDILRDFWRKDNMQTRDVTTLTVNRIRELPQNTNIVATHTDCPEVLIWDVESQPDRSAVLGAGDSRPDLVLTGHQENAEFALAMCPVEPLVLSGGKDKSVVLWSIQDHVSTLGLEQTVGTAGSITKASDNSSLGPRGIFQGHEDTVEDVQFCPSSAQEFCSVGDDSCLILWDARAGFSPAVKVNKAHDADIHCVDWNPHDANLILTGSADHSVCLFDRRKLTSNEVGSPIQKFEGHSAAVLCVQWSPHVSSVFGSSAEDAFLNIWDYAKVDKQKSWENMKHSPPGLFFRHAGHRDKVVDFHWNAADPWTIVSVSDDADTSGGGGTLQIWRMSDLIYRPEEEVLSEIEKFKAHVSECNSKS